jgi:peptidoglycan/LPS O-acetylase OafA/YrhL
MGGPVSRPVFTMDGRQGGGGQWRVLQGAMNRFAALDGLRGICALAIALFHLQVAIHFYTSALLREAYIFVDFFFVLSGFVIAYAYSQRLGSGKDVVEFVVRRIGRLWPLHVAVLAAFLVIEIGRLLLAGNLVGAEVRIPFSGDTSLDTLAPNLFLIHAWVWSELTWNIPSWSISAELFAYLVFAAVLFFARRNATLVAVVIFVAAWSASVATAVNVDLFSHLASIRAVAGFFAGVLVYAAYQNFERANWSLWLATLLEGAAVGAVLIYLGFFSRHEVAPWSTPIFAAAVFIFASERGLVSALLKSQPLQVLGMLSYSIYMTHPLISTFFNAGSKVLGHIFGRDFQEHATELFPQVAHWAINWNIVHFGNFWLNDLYALAFVAMVIAVSAVTYRYVELPGQRLFAGLAKRCFAKPATAGSPSAQP